ncbi:MAG: hypothetical protein FWG77_09575 [Treponema sp.]|nr:hypothetical protein [Treponema sp.]
MGTDMHCIIEALNKKTGKWDCFGVSTANRYYRMFSRIADVRNSESEETYIEPIDGPRGWPADVSDPAESWSKYYDLPFSQTWLNRAELEALNRWECEDNEKGNLWEFLGFGHLSYFFSLEGSWAKAAFVKYSDLRVLFFFDN